MKLLWIVLGIAILLKVAFLVRTFRAKGFKPSRWLYLILIGVAMILTAMVFKFLYPAPLLRDIFFYGAITLKTTGLIGLIVQKKKQT